MWFSNESNKFWVNLAILICTIGLAKPAAGAEPGGEESIETRVMRIPGPVWYPDPICLKCKIVVRSSTTTDETMAQVSVDYTDEQWPELEADLELTILLGNGQWRVVLLEGVCLASGEATEVEVMAGADWSWSEVEVVAVQVLPQV